MRSILLGLICILSYAAESGFDPITVGTPVPAAAIATESGDAADLAEALGGEPSVLIVYRGGWCPFCNAQLGQLATVADELQAAGLRLVALSPDSPTSIAAARQAGKLDERIIVWSDGAAHAIRALGLAFEVDAQTIEKYRGYGIDLEAASGHDHHLLPVPAVIVVDAAGVVRFVHADPDYKRRLDAQAVLAVATSMAQ